MLVNKCVLMFTQEYALEIEFSSSHSRCDVHQPRLGLETRSNFHFPVLMLVLSLANYEQIHRLWLNFVSIMCLFLHCELSHQLFFIGFGYPINSMAEFFCVRAALVLGQALREENLKLVKHRNTTSDYSTDVSVDFSLSFEPEYEIFQELRLIINGNGDLKCDDSSNRI